MKWTSLEKGEKTIEDGLILEVGTFPHWPCPFLKHSIALALAYLKS